MSLAKVILHKMVHGYSKLKQEELMKKLPAQIAGEIQKSVGEGKPIPSIQIYNVTAPTRQITQVLPSAQQVVPQIGILPGVQVVGGMPGEIKGKLELLPAKEEIEIKGFEIPAFAAGKVKAGGLREEEEGPRRSLTYPLIPAKPAKDEPVMAYTKIYWDKKANRYVYELVEPPLTDDVKDKLFKLKELMEERLDVDFSKLKISEATEFLRQQMDQMIELYSLKLNETEKRILQYFIERDFMGLGKIEPLMRDQMIEDISCDGVGIPIFIYHRDPDIGSVVSNVKFDSAEELDSFIIKLSQLAGKSISVAEPLVDGTLPDGSRLQATLATDIARKGSNFTIRKFIEEPLTPIHLLNYKTVDVKTLAYLWMAVDYGRSILVAGGTASGKTTLLNVLSLFIRPEKKIVSIEDTAELKLPHPHWVPSVARTSVSGAAKEIDMYRLLKESMRQRPEYIVVGEVRGQEAFILFQQIATGHPSLATIHADDIDKLVDRLTTAPISLPHSLIGSLDLIVFISRMRIKDKFVRRLNEVLEMIKFSAHEQRPIVNRVFKWNPIGDKIEVTEKSMLLKKISDVTGMNEQEVKDEMERRMMVLNWMHEKNITNYQDVYKILNMYYYYPQRVIGAIMGET